jgi:hypothetical protein
MWGQAGGSRVLLLPSKDRDGEGANGRECEGIHKYISSKDGIENLVCRLERMEREEGRRLIGMWV